MKKILFINHKIAPYVPECEMSLMGRRVPQVAQESGSEIRTFMPKWGDINERRGQLHEVQRLSGMNIIIDDTDHPLIIKVASIPQTKIQVYFIDNDEYFFKLKPEQEEKEMTATEVGERAIFFARGVIETMKKLRWSPDIIHCQGWMSAFVPLYIKEAYQDEPSVCNAKIVTSIYDEVPAYPFEADMKNKIAFKDITAESIADVCPDNFSIESLYNLAIENSDGVIAASENLDQKIIEMAQNAKAKFLPYAGEDFKDSYLKFYDSLFEGE